MVIAMSFKQYYEHYLCLHQNKHCRRLHLVGMVVASIFAVAVLMTSYWWLCALAPLLVYPFAWTGHFVFEKNTPATFRHPLLAGLSDLHMTWDICRGRLEL